MLYSTKTTKKIWATMILGAFVSLSLFGVLVGSKMSMNKSEGMSPCPYMQDSSSICPMNLIDHIQAWQNTMRANPIKRIILILAGFLFTYIFLFLFKRFLQSKEFGERRKIKMYELKHRTFNTPFLFTYLFSQGILNSKLY